MLNIYRHTDSDKVKYWQKKHWNLAAKLVKHADPLTLLGFPKDTLNALVGSSFLMLRGTSS